MLAGKGGGGEGEARFKAGAKMTQLPPRKGGMFSVGFLGRQEAFSQSSRISPGWVKMTCGARVRSASTSA